MKLILILALFTTSLFAFAQSGTESEKDLEAENASRRILQKKRERMVVPPVTTTKEVEREEIKEEQINDDADPELDAIDDDMTEDEGLNDD